MALSAVRNVNKMNLTPYQMRKAKTSERLQTDYVKNLAVFNGLKALCVLYAILAFSFLFTWYAYLADPSQVVSYRENVLFLSVYAVYFAPSVLFLAAGFLQTFNFLSQDQNDMFKPRNLAKYYAWRLVKFVPLIGMALIFCMFVFPFLGSGPIWSFYGTVM